MSLYMDLQKYGGDEIKEMMDGLYTRIISHVDKQEKQREEQREEREEKQNQKTCEDLLIKAMGN